MEGVMHYSSIVKRKRTNRQRLQLSLAEATPASISESATEEGEDMANCLMLLAQDSQQEPNVTEETTAKMKSTSRRFKEAATTAGGKAGYRVFACNDCSKCFFSFQAFGGHRASHKKPRLSISPTPTDETKAVAQVAAKVAANGRIHKCSICGAVFNSGQALGGHMRRHRVAMIHEPAKKEGNSKVLSFDLNLPPPCDNDDDLAEPSSSIPSTKTPPLSFRATCRFCC